MDEILKLVMLSEETRGKSRLGVEKSEDAGPQLRFRESPRTVRLFFSLANFQVLLALRLGMSGVSVELHSSALLQPAAPGCFDYVVAFALTPLNMTTPSFNFAQLNLSPGWIATQAPSVKSERTKPALQGSRSPFTHTSTPPSDSPGLRAVPVYSTPSTPPAPAGRSLRRAPADQLSPS